MESYSQKFRNENWNHYKNYLKIDTDSSIQDFTNVKQLKN